MTIKFMQWTIFSVWKYLRIKYSSLSDDQIKASKMLWLFQGQIAMRQSQHKTVLILLFHNLLDISSYLLKEWFNLEFIGGWIYKADSGQVIPYCNMSPKQLSIGFDTYHFYPSKNFLLMPEHIPESCKCKRRVCRANKP